MKRDETLQVQCRKTASPCCEPPANEQGPMIRLLQADTQVELPGKLCIAAGRLSCVPAPERCASTHPTTSRSSGNHSSQLARIAGQGRSASVRGSGSGSVSGTRLAWAARDTRSAHALALCLPPPAPPTRTRSPSRPREPLAAARPAQRPAISRQAVASLFGSGNLQPCRPRIGT